MKKILLSFIIIIIGFISGFYFFQYQKNSEVHSVNAPIYKLKGKLYYVASDKPVSGYIQASAIEYGYSGNGFAYLKYENGILKSKVITNENDTLTYKSSYNSNGLLDGKAYLYRDGQNKNFEYLYENGILSGASLFENISLNFSDGTINGKNTFEYGHPTTDGKINYINGVPDFIDLALPKNIYPKILLINEKAPKNFTGGILETQENQMILSEFINGDLVRKRFYTGERSSIPGIKFKDYFYTKYDGVTKIKQKFEYQNGLLKEIISFNAFGKKDGLFFSSNISLRTFVIQHYTNNFLNGKFFHYFVKKENKIIKNSGFFNLGVYSGENSIDAGFKQDFLNGIPVENINLNQILSQKLIVVSNLEQIPNNFTGFNSKNNRTIIEYNNGKKTKEYSNQNFAELTIKIFDSNDNYEEQIYRYGKLRYIFEYKGQYKKIYDNGKFLYEEKKYVKNGKYVEYINNNLSAKTIGQFKNNKPDGKFIHYHHNKVYYIDIYSPDDTYIRTFYSDYDNNIVKSVETGRLNKFGLYEKDININTDQLKTLKLN